MRKTLVAAAAAFIGSFGIAAAADLGGYNAPMKEPPVEPLPPTWEGFYIGGNVGWGWANFSNDFLDCDPTLFFCSGSGDGDGFIYGGQIGYNFQRDSLVFGLEASFNGTNMDASTFSDVKTEVNWYGTGVGRLGVAYENWLFYGFGGVAWGDVRTRIFDFGSDRSTQVGWTAGGGIERMLPGMFPGLFSDSGRWNNYSIRLEYAHVDLSDDTVFSGTIEENRASVDFDVVKLALNYKFGPREEPMPPLK